MVLAVELGQIVFGSLLVAILVGMAGYFAWRQWVTLRGLRHHNDLSADERVYLHRLAWRRLICSAFMLVLAALLAGHFVLENRADELIAAGQASNDRGEKPELTSEDQRFLNLRILYWFVTMLVLLGIITLAGVDFMAIRRFGRRQFKQLQADRRAMLENEIARIRSQRNGHS